jgi:hypothetical protein
MKFLVITGNPKKTGLCHAVTREILRGGRDGGADMGILADGPFLPPHGGRHF